MKVDAEKLAEALKRVGGAVYGNYCEAAVTVGAVREGITTEWSGDD